MTSDQKYNSTNSSEKLKIVIGTKVFKTVKAPAALSLLSTPRLPYILK
jgi:hypothetical protein